jgi:DNA invertase Pin-like site-specific DNA recombinase
MLASVGDLGNSSRIIAKAIQNIRSAGFHLVSEADGFDTRWPHGDAVLTAANLVLDMQQHWRADKKPKAGPVMTPERLYTAKILMQDDSLTVQEVADTIGVSKSALYRALKEERDQAAREQHDHLQRIGRLPKREKP